MFKIKKQLSALYLSSVLGNLSLTGAWVAILAARGFTLPEIGLAETVFHITSLIFEIPSGVLADVLGRKKMLIVSSIMRMTANAVMIFSNSLFTVCVSIAFQALAYNFASGSDEALAYDSLKKTHCAEKFENYISNQLIIYRLCSGVSTLCAGFALSIGHRLAYSTDVVMCAVQIAVLSNLYEMYAVLPSETGTLNKILRELRNVLAESLSFVKNTKKTARLMFCNSLVGAFDTLLLFFLQAKLPEKGIPEWALGIALLFMETGGIVGSRLILKFPKLRYHEVFAVTFMLVLTGFFAEHTGNYIIMALGGFISALADDALQVRTNAVLQDTFPSEQRATLTSLGSFSFSVVMIVLSPLAGIVFSVW